MIKIILISLLSFFSEIILAQEDYNIDSSQVYIFVDTLPKMPDGSDIVMGIRDILKNYQFPDSLDCEYYTLLKFELEIKYDGSIINKKVDVPDNRNECKADYEKIQTAGMRLLNSIPKCQPGMRNGKFVTVKLFFPMHIHLQYNK